MIFDSTVLKVNLTKQHFDIFLFLLKLSETEFFSPNFVMLFYAKFIVNPKCIFYSKSIRCYCIQSFPPACVYVPIVCVVSINILTINNFIQTVIGF